MKDKKPESFDMMLTRVKNHLKMGQPTKYIPKDHIPLVVEVFGRGEGVAAFCAQAIICQKTFFKWLEAHEEFNRAYRVALNMGQRYWETPGMINKINANAWRAIMRNRFHYDRVRIKHLTEGASAVDRMQTVWKGVEEGDLDTADATRLAQLAVTQVQIEDRVPITTSNPIPKDELMSQIATIKAVMDAQDKEKE